MPLYLRRYSVDLPVTVHLPPPFVATDVRWPEIPLLLTLAERVPASPAPAGVAASAPAQEGELPTGPDWRRRPEYIDNITEASYDVITRRFQIHHRNGRWIDLPLEDILASAGAAAPEPAPASPGAVSLTFDLYDRRPDGVIVPRFYTDRTAPAIVATARYVNARRGERRAEIDATMLLLEIAQLSFGLASATRGQWLRPGGRSRGRAGARDPAPERAAVRSGTREGETAGAEALPRGPRAANDNARPWGRPTTGQAPEEAELPMAVGQRVRAPGRAPTHSGEPAEDAVHRTNRSERNRNDHEEANTRRGREGRQAAEREAQAVARGAARALEGALRDVLRRVRRLPDRVREQIAAAPDRLAAVRDALVRNQRGFDLDAALLGLEEMPRQLRTSDRAVLTRQRERLVELLGEVLQ